MKRMLAGLCALVFIAAGAAYATPTLGVATDTGQYAYTGGAAPGDEYINYFADTLFSANNGYEGFVVGASGSKLIVFTSYDPTSTDLWLMSNTGGDNFPISFGGQTLAQIDTGGQIDGYNNPSQVYYGTLLTKNAAAWTVHDFERPFYLYEAELTYGGTLSYGDYFFAVAENNGEAGIQFGPGQKDDFSPKTSSAIGGYPTDTPVQPVPEPSSMLLLGTGLLGMLGVRRFGTKKHA